MEQLLIFIATPLYAIFILGEIALSQSQNLHLYKRRDVVNNIAMGVLGGLLDLVMKGVCFFSINYVVNNYTLFKIENTLLNWIGVFVVQDFCFYWLHRVEHYCRFFWAVHVNHHSSNYFNFTVALRSSVLQPFYRYFFFLPCGLFGFSGEQVMFIYAVNQTYAFFVHTKTIGKLGFLEYFLVTPSHHRVHHGSNIKYLDKNMGQVLIIWDKLFGTFQPEQDEVEYGLTKPLHENTPVYRLVFHEWKSIWQDIKKPVSLKNKIMYLFGPPGWSHDGSSLTSSQLRKKK